MNEQNQSEQITPVQLTFLPRYASLDGVLRWVRKYRDSAQAPSASNLRQIKGGVFGRVTAHGPLLAEVVQMGETVLSPKESILAAFQNVFKHERSGMALPFEGLRVRFEFQRDALTESWREPASLDASACRLIHEVAEHISCGHLDSIKMSYLIGRKHRGGHSAFEVLVLPLALRRSLREKTPPAPEAPGRLEAKWLSSSELLAFWKASATRLITGWSRSHVS